jgi:diguanylate cyclase (GGDEF)-like protein
MSHSASSDAAGSERSTGRLGSLAPRALFGRGLGEEGSGLTFGARLFVAVVVALGLCGVTGFLLLEHKLAHRQIADFALAQRTDAEAFEQGSSRATTKAAAIAKIDSFIDSVGRRPGTREVLLIDWRGTIVASNHEQLVGTHDSDRAIDSALRRGTFYAGRENDASRDQRDFEFVSPLELFGARYAYEVSYDHRTYDAHLNEVREILALVGLLAVFGGGAVFYLVGGRRLMHDHMTVLRRATRDGLTELSNQRAFQDELPAAVGSAVRYQDPLALALLDVDDFKLVNDRRGHPFGDVVLARVADVLREARPGDRAYRIGGDEFALLLAHTDADGGRVLAKRLNRAFADAGIEASIGVSSLRPGLQAGTLRAEADGALYEAKRQGGNRSVHFDDIRGRVVVITSEKKEAVRRLVAEGRITTLFQPIWDLGQERLLGVEALTRPDPSYELSGPAEAFDIAEQIGRVRQLDVLCVESALRSAPALEPGVLLFLNLSPITLELDADGDCWLLPLLERAGLDPRSVVIEVTERFGGRTPAVVRQLRRLREEGFKTALDDVGTGNSGLEMLRKLEAEFVKLDRSIVVAAATEPGARAVLMAMATFARQTGAYVIAEGIEDEETLAYLRSLDDSDLAVDAIVQGGQGFGLGRPSPDLAPSLPEMLDISGGHHSRLTLRV